MRVHYIKVQQERDPEAVGRNSSGGRPVLIGNQQWPKCKLCKQKMVLFFQLDIEKRFDLPLKPGSHLLVFMCPIHNDAPTELVPDGENELPTGYWEKDFGHYKLILNKNPLNEQAHASEGFIHPASLVFDEGEEEIEWDGFVETGTHGFKIGGVPAWEAAPGLYKCSCRAEMVFLVQVPENFIFQRAVGAPVQPDTNHPDGYNIFMGKSTYIFACKEQCHPEALYVVAQEHDPARQMTA